MAGLQQAVLRKPGHCRIGLALQSEVAEQTVDDLVIGNLQTRHEVGGLGAIQRVVIDEEHVWRAQLHGRDLGRKARALGLPVYAREDEILPDASLRQHLLHVCRIVFRTDGADDAAPRQCHDNVVHILPVGHATFGQGAVPKHLIEVPDHKPHVVDDQRHRPK